MITNFIQTCYSAAGILTTRCSGMCIAREIRITIIWITLIVFLGMALLKIVDAIVKGCQDKRDRKKENDEKDRKRKAELLDKKLEFLKEYCYKASESDKCKKTLTVYGDEAVERYLDALDGKDKPSPQEGQSKQS